jgi:hypothetical protein
MSAGLDSAPGAGPDAESDAARKRIDALLRARIDADVRLQSGIPQGRTMDSLDFIRMTGLARPMSPSLEAEAFAARADASLAEMDAVLARILPTAPDLGAGPRLSAPALDAAGRRLEEAMELLHALEHQPRA